MSKKARSISAADLAKLTRTAVKDATEGIQGRFIGKGPTMGFILESRLSPARQLTLATRIASGVNAEAADAGIPGLNPQAVVVTRPGRIIAGFLTPELRIQIR